MGRITYAMMQSLDGYITDSNGEIDWVLIDDEIHSFANNEAKRANLDIYGRRMYETMAAWETLGDEPGSSEVEKEFAREWKRMDKLVISTTLPNAVTGRTRLVRAFDPGEVRALAGTIPGRIGVSGPTLASAFIAAGLVDEIGTYIMPVVLGGGQPFIPPSHSRLRLDLTEERRFESGAVFLRYDVRR